MPPPSGPPTDYTQLTDFEKSILYMTASPVGRILGVGEPKSTRASIQQLRDLPENLKRALFAEETAWRIYQLAVPKHQLSREQTGHLADTVKDVFLGEESAANLSRAVRDRVGVTVDVAQDIARELTREFITPNYFQIAQVYEKKHPKGTGDRGQGTGRPPPAPAGPPPLVTPPRVVDLRGGPVPSRLPPTPAVAPPPGAMAGRPAVAPPASPPLLPLQEGERSPCRHRRPSTRLGVNPSTKLGGNPLPPQLPSAPPPPPPPTVPPPRGGEPALPPETARGKPRIAPGPSPDDLIKKLNQKPLDTARGKPPAPPPPPFQRPPGGGEHGPLPSPPK